MSIQESASGNDQQPFAVETYFFEDTGKIPNNPSLPLIVYRDILDPQEEDAASALEEVFAANDWTNSWRDTIYDYDHFHTTAHEVLGIAEGSVSVRFGGAKGRELTLEKGDVVVSPAGVGHRRRSASKDLLVVGAYAQGHDYDMRESAKDDEKIRRDIAALPHPKCDPVAGEDGPLLALWAQ
jgi:uncharacterized protein YjlB